ncbi:uncharacterized protein N0V89_009020 [Didymosphaeria variabile]|uniref:Glycosyltransferase 2-like domain-containing protein n=1 Tax=Didymosphaeria variabile TaxID=1932322 RepID=A0A9W8XIT7_9PLEO|nr:uncharacterized protein N0V89_009020 [Didymosphaeria variabile]KAJ4350399.1 hypothetical protein N0V89_009020 [Didymosphaeria variabile]
MTLEVKCAMTANFLHAKQEEKLWTTGAHGEGVFLKKGRGSYITCPETLKTDGSRTYDAIYELNVKVTQLHVDIKALSAKTTQVAMTIKNKVIDLLLSDSEIPFVQINEGLRLQVIPDIEALPFCQKHQSAAFVLSEKMLVVWEDQPHMLIKRVTDIDEALFNIVCRGLPLMDELDRDDPKDTFYHWQGVHDETEEDEKRSIVIWQPFFTASTLVLALGALGGGWRQISIQITIDGGYLRLLFLLCLIPQLGLGLFFFQALVGNLAQIIGCVGHMRSNTKVYSGKAPYRLCASDLPHVTIQMPIFKENLKTVIAPTLRSLKEAISTYEMQGGSANIFVNDDGMQLMSDEEAKERQDWFDDNNVGWVARPPHNPDGKLEDKPIHTRRGKFKKASNMNYGLRVSTDLEEELIKSRWEFQRENNDWSQQDENDAYTDELMKIIDRNGTWADGNIRIGDYILIVDSDTRVPADCLLEVVSEMERYRDVAVLQFASGVMNVTTSFFEKGITFFTNLVYTQIKFAVSNGDVAPFVGHNAVLRWSAVQEIAYKKSEELFLPKRDNDGHLVLTDVVNEETGEPVLDETTEQPLRRPVYEQQDVQVEKYWSEETVSEDFDMALRLQINGYIVRLAAYQGDGFKEGVSLTVYDELQRWENELIFHPFQYWIRRGPFTGLIIRFLTSSIPLPSKLTIIAYIGTYYALGSAWVFTVCNYFLVGWFNGLLDHYYIDSFKVYFSIICVFSGLGNVALAWMRYRNNEGSLPGNLAENLRWVLLLVIFLGGISFHISHALVWHMLDLEMTWGATAKEVENIPFFEEIAVVFKRFKWTFAWCFGTAGMMVFCAYGLDPIWQIRFFTPIYPLSTVLVSHFLVPIVLNPNLMRFTW